MKKLILIFVFGLIYSSSSQPITTPIKWEGLDTLSKFYHFEQIKKQYQPHNSENEKSGIPFRKEGQNEILDLMTDPRVLYSSYFGGNGYDCSYGIAVDSKDNIILVGYTGSTNLPTTEGCFQKNKSGSHDAFIAKFTSNGQPIWITYYGGSGTDVAKGLVIDKNDNIYVVGKTNSTDFPITKGKFHGYNAAEAFILKFNSVGERVWATLYGSSEYDTGEGIALMSDGGVVIAGYTNGSDLQVTDNALYKSLQGSIDAFIARFTSDGDLIWGTYYGGSQNEITTCIATDKNDNIAIGGYHQTVPDLPGPNIFPATIDAFQRDSSGKEDCFISKFDSNGYLKYATLYGGSQKDILNGICFDFDGNYYFTGMSESSNFPITANAYKQKFDSYDVIIVKFNSNNEREFATFYGGLSADKGISISCNKDNSIWITGWTISNDFPIIGYSIQGIPNPGGIGSTQIILLKLDVHGKPLYSAYYGYYMCFGYSIYLKNNDIYLTGETASPRFPYTKNAYQYRIIPAEYTSYLVKVDLTHTGVIESTNPKEIKIFPNPSTDFIEISTTHLSESLKLSESYNYSIYNVFGIKLPPSLISSATPQEGNLKIDVSALAPGVYFVRIGDKVMKFLKI